MLVNDIRERVQRLNNRHPVHWVCLTGGEPLIQDIKPLIRMLRQDGWKIQVETNATRFVDIPVDWFTVSPKPKRYAYRAEFAKRAREVKLVVSKELEFKTVKKVRNSFPEKIPLFLQVQSEKKWSFKKAGELLEQAAAENLKTVRLGVQLHKILGLP